MQFILQEPELYVFLEPECKDWSGLVLYVAGFISMRRLTKDTRVVAKISLTGWDVSNIWKICTRKECLQSWVSSDPQEDTSENIPSFFPSMDIEGLCSLCGGKIFVMPGRKKAIPSSAGQTWIKGRKEWKGIGNQLGKKHLRMKSLPFLKKGKLLLNFKEGLRLLCLRRARGKRDTITLRSFRGDGIPHAFKLAKYS